MGGFLAREHQEKEESVPELPEGWNSSRKWRLGVIEEKLSPVVWTMHVDRSSGALVELKTNEN